MGQGQYFTPRGAVDLMVAMLDPKEHERLLDPACGTGSFPDVGSASEWPYSSFARYSEQGVYPPEWGSGVLELDGVGHE